MIIALDKRNSIFYFQNNSWGIPTGKCLPGFPEREISGERSGGRQSPWGGWATISINCTVLGQPWKMDEGLIMIHGW